MRIATLALAVTLSMGGCKWKKEAEALAQQLDAAQAESAQKQETIEDKNATITQLENEVADLQARIDDLQADIAALESDLDAERERNAQMMASRGKLREEVEDMKQALADLQRRKEAAEARVAQFRELVSRFQSMIDAGKLDVRIADGRMVIVLATDVLFASGSADLSEDGMVAVAQVAEMLSGFTDRRFQVEGHTDNVPIRTSKYPSNWHLAAARAIGVVNTMLDNGMEPSTVSAASFADTRPVASNDEPEGRALNRRIEIAVLPDLSELPGYEELQDIEG